MQKCRTAPLSTSERREVPSLSEMMRQQLRVTDVRKRPNGHEQNLANQKIRDGRVRACGYLEDALCDEFAAGMTVPQFLAFVGRFRRWGLMHLGAIGDLRDLNAASMAEQRAQCALDPKQMEAFDAGTVTPELLEAMQPAADWDAEASANYALSIDVARVTMWRHGITARDKAQYHMAAAR